MELKYVGPKPIISHTGIEFDNNKEDKYAYLNIVVQFLHALDHEYIQDRVYSYDLNTARMDNHLLMQSLRKYCPELDSVMKSRGEETQKMIEHDLERAEENETLTSEEKSVLIKNIKMMREYLLQRSVNKSVYYCAIEALAELLRKDNIDYLIAPMFQKFAHVMHSVQGMLCRGKYPIRTNLDIYQEDNKLLVKLKVMNST
jgi:hypothetical protein